MREGVELMKKLEKSKYKDFLTKYIEHIITALILIPVSIIFMIHPLNGDIRTYQGVARLADYFGSFPTNIDLAYESKPIANRMLNYFLYKISSIFTTFGTPEYEMLIKFISILCVIIICYYFSTKFENKYIFLLSVLAFLTPTNTLTLIPDWWAPLIALFALTLFLTNKPSNHYLSGIMITIMFLLKGPTIILVIPIACALYLLKDNDWLNCLKRGAISSSLFLIFILLCGYFKNIIPDMILSTYYVHQIYYDFQTTLILLIQNLIPLYFCMPIFIAGLIGACILYLKLTKNKEINKILMLILMWISSLLYIFIQNEFYLTHYLILLVPSIISLILLSNKLIKQFITIIIIIFIILTVVSIYETDKEPSIANRIIENISAIQNQEHILYLDSGQAPYYFQSNTSCRFIQSLPFQRNTDIWNITTTPYYQENFKCIMDYQGKYIIMDGYLRTPEYSINGIWFEQNTSDNKLVMSKIQTEYKQVWNEGWNIYERRS